MQNGTETSQQLATKDMMDYALEYAARGWRVIPLHTPDGDGNCSCHTDCGKSNSKHPRTMNGLKDATTDEETIRRWWDMWPDANIGIRTGAESNIAVLDVDPRNGGNKSLAAMELENGRLPETLTSNTGGDGRHFLFTRPEAKLNKEAGAGLDIKGDGGYIVAPPSLHASGKRYEWANGAEIAPMPEWLLGKATAKAKTNNVIVGDFGSADFTAWEPLHAELRRRILAHESVNFSSDGQWAQAKGICHDGKGDTAIFLNLKSGAYGCHKKCDTARIREAFGLSATPNALQSPVASTGGQPTRLGLSWREFSAQVFPETEPVIVGLEKGEVGLLIAATNIGKTTLALNLALSLAVGKDFKPLTKDGAKPRRVLVIDGETRRRRMQRDIRAMEREWLAEEQELLKGNLYVMCDSELNGTALSLSNAQHMTAVRREAQEFAPDLIIVDTLAELFTVVSENDNAEMQNKVMRPLNQLAKDVDAAVLVLHHIGKMSEEAQSSTQAYRGRGASAIGGSARLVLTLTPDTKNKRIVTLSCGKSKGDDFEDVMLRLNQELRRFVPVAGGVAAKLDGYQQTLAAARTIKRPFNRRDLVESLSGGLSPSTVDKNLKAAFQRGDLLKLNKGVYDFPEAEPTSPNNSVGTLITERLKAA